MLAETAIKIGKSRNKQDWEQDTERAQAKQNTKTNKMNNTDPTKYRVGEQHRPHQIQGGGTTQTPPNTGRVNNTDPTKYREGEQHRPHQIQGGGTTQTPLNTGRVNYTDSTKYREDEHSCPQSLKDDEPSTSFYKLKIDLSCAFIQLDFTITFIVAWCFY